jgi:hypothetical protein
MFDNVGKNIVPKIKSRITGAVDNTKSTVNDLISTAKTGSPRLIEIPKQHAAKFRDLNQPLKFWK